MQAIKTVRVPGKLIFRSLARFVSDTSTPSSTLKGVSSLDIEKDAWLNHSSKLKKLSFSLNKPSKRELTEKSQGLQESVSLDLMDVMNEVILDHKFFMKPNSNNKMSSDWTEKLLVPFLEITNVELNQDISHLHAFWSSEPLLLLFQKIFQQSPNSLQHYNKVLQIMKNVNHKLAHKEGKFRSAIITKINFKKVPRLLFQADLSIQTLVKQYKMLIEQMK